jgi:hypothetical protein
MLEMFLQNYSDLNHDNNDNFLIVIEKIGYKKLMSNFIDLLSLFDE